MRRCRWIALIVVGSLVALAPAAGLDGPPETALHRMQFEHPSLHLHSPPVPASSYQVDDRARARLDRLKVPHGQAFVDPHSGGWATLVLRQPLIPGRGKGNDLDWSDLGVASPADDPEIAAAVESAFVDYLRQNASSLGWSLSELVRPLQVTVHRSGDLIQIRGRREFGGVPIRDSGISAVVSHGNLVLVGSRNWSAVAAGKEPSLSAAEADRSLRSHLRSWTVTDLAQPSQLVYLPYRPHDETDAAARDRTPDAPLRYRLAWVVRPEILDHPGRWQAIVDAADGSVLAFSDLTRHAATRKVSGGVFPVSNDGEIPDGVEQPSWPMPFAEVQTDAGAVTTDSSGHLPSEVGGDISTALTGPFAAIDETCGQILEESDGDLDLGAGPGTDCEVPPGASPGNTHSARTTFYELNRIKEAARGQLPSNPWLQQQLTAITNVTFACSALWDGESIQLSGGGFGCAAAGEIASIVDHEWAHGMDQNDASGAITRPAEGIADAYAALRLDSSCIGRGLLPFVCNGYGDPCISCDGVRDVDWAQRVSGQPHDLAWAVANCSTGSSGTPCGRLDHCESVVVSETIWDLYRRTLPAPPHDLDSNAALEIATRLTFLGAGAVDNWYTCDGGGGSGDGCNADGGYLNYLAADDDNGSLTDGTPHMTAIFAAFDAHGIACSVPTVQDGGCAGGPTSAPAVTATTGDRSVALTWDAVPGAQAYAVFRTEGVFACDFGKVRIGETAATSFVDSEVRNDFEVYYTVAAIGPADSCIGPMSSCVPATPTAASGMSIEVGGSCPGDVRVEVSGATPGAQIALAAARNGGTFTFPNGPCAGTELDLNAPRLVGRRTANDQGRARFTFSLQGPCGALVQALDSGSCAVSPVGTTP